MHLQNVDQSLLEQALRRWNDLALRAQSGPPSDLSRTLSLFETAIDKHPVRSPSSVVLTEAEKRIDELLDFPSHRLAVYGSLAPGAENHWVLSELHGVWTKGTVKGHRDAAGWGQTLGFPALIWDPKGDEIAVDLFDSPELPEHWQRIDEFEGDDYKRILVPVTQSSEVVVANIYALAVQS